MLPQTSATNAVQNVQQPDKYAYRDRSADADAFAQVFANTQELSKPRDKIAPRDNNNPEPHEAPIRSSCRRHETSAPRNDERDDTRVSTAEGEEEHTETAEAKPVQANHEEKPKTCQKAEKKKAEGECAETTGKESSTPDGQTAQTDTAEAAEAAQLMEGLDVVVDTSADEKPAVVFCLSPALQAQVEASESCGTGDKEDGAKSSAGQKDQDALQNLLSFRTDIKTGVAASGKGTGTDASATPVVKEDLLASLAVHAEDGETAETETLPESHAGDVLLLETPAGEANDTFDALANHLPKSKKEEIKEQTLAAAKGEAKTDANSGLTSPPAAGSRVNALMGVPAPTPTGSGGGSPPTVKGGDMQISGVSLTSAGNDLSNSASVQLTRAAPGMAHLPPSEQVGITVARMVKAGVTQFEMQLSPAELGKVGIKLEINKDGLVRATVTADNPAAYAALQKDAGAMEKILQQAGLETDANSLSFNLREGETQSHQQEANQNAPGWKRWNENAGTVDQGEQAQMALYIATPGRVDVTV
jgi:flagellar hook-length control protein FliK